MQTTGLDPKAYILIDLHITIVQLLSNCYCVGAVSLNPKPILHMNTLNLNVLRGFMVAPSWFYGRAFVVFWSRLRGFMVAPSWFYGRAFVVLWSRIRGFMVAQGFL